MEKILVHTYIYKGEILRFNDKICVPNDVEIKKIISEEVHKRKLSIHSGTKKYILGS